jgi:CBS domain-containing protein
MARAGKVARADVPTCSLDERLGDVAERAAAEGWDSCVVVNEQRVVLGLLRSAELGGHPDLRIEEAMRPGPSTYRPHVAVRELARLMVEHDVESYPITTSDGRLVGVLRREDSIAAAHREHGGAGGAGA